MSSQPSFFGSLFDFSFSRFVTLRLVKFLYVVSMILMVFFVIGLIAAGFTEAVSGVEAIGYIVLAPIVAFLYLIVVRVGFELVVVVFRIGETATEMRDLLSKSSSSSSVAGD